MQKFLASIPIITPTPNKRLDVKSKQLLIYLIFTEQQKIHYVCVTVTKTPDCVTLYAWANSHQQEVVYGKGLSSLHAVRKQRGDRK